MKKRTATSRKVPLCKKNDCCVIVVDNKAKGRMSKPRKQEKQRKQSTPNFPKNKHFLLPDNTRFEIRRFALLERKFCNNFPFSNSYRKTVLEGIILRYIRLEFSI